MTGSCFVWGKFKQRKEKALFKGTLLGILVSFFILFGVAYLLNLAENYFLVSKPSKNESAREKTADEVSWNAVFGIKVAQAATLPVPYKAVFSGNSSDKLELLPGEEITYRVNFQNAGTAVWKNTGANFVSIYTYIPKYRPSVFKGTGWLSSSQPAKLKQAQVKPGEIGFFEFKIKAPKTLGSYTENFRLAAENKSWVDGTDFSVPILVVGKKNDAGHAIMPTSAELKPAVAVTAIATTAPRPFTAELLLKSTDKIEAKAGEAVDVRLVYKNVGTANWDLVGLIIPEEALEEDGKSVFYYPTWPSGHQPSVLGVSVTRPGQTVFLDFKIKAPDAGGDYVVKLKLVANYDREVANGVVEIPMTVASEAAPDTTDGRVKMVMSKVEPPIEVGLMFTTADSPSAVELMSDKAYKMLDKDGVVLASLAPSEPVAVNYDFSQKVFIVRNARINMKTVGELHFKGETGAIFTILSMSRPTAYGQNDNQYREELILRQADTTGRLWLINRLPMEEYLYGIAETTNGAPLEFIKANLVAARTYALYHQLNPYKYNGYFTVQYTTADQYYRGYGSELRRPNIVAAVDATKGQVITYQNDVVVTPYFGHSDGRTRTWSEAWGGADRPWIKSVPAIYDAGLEMFGHGIGMSQNEAALRAKNDGWDYVRILKYYYSGIEISKMY
jgi:peptidoglycan hydrolase-like amidase